MSIKGKNAKRVSAAIMSGVVALSAFATVPCVSTDVTAAGSTAAALSSDAPSVVTGLTYTSKANSITLSWNASKDASGYYIYVKSSKEPYDYFRLDAVEDGKATSWIREGLSSGKIYEFRVQPYKTVGTKNIVGDYTEIIASTLPGSVRKVSTSENTETSVTVKWGAVSGADGYCIDRKLTTVKDYKRVKVINGQSVTEWKDTSLEAGKDYYYVVRPFKRVNGKVIYGEYIKITASTLPGALTGLATNARTANAIKLTWNASKGASGYYIYVKSSKEPYNFVKLDTVEGGSTRSYVRRELSSGKIYEFRVQPYKTVGGKTYKGDYSEIITGTLPGTVRTVVTSDPTSNSVLVKWGAVSGADGYNISRKISGESSYKEVKTVNDPTVTWWTDDSLSAGIDCIYAVRAYKIINGKYVYSAYVKKDGYTVPNEIDNLSVESQTANTVTLSWSETEGASGYDVFRMSTKEPGKYVRIGTVDSKAVTKYTDEKLASGTTYSYKVAAFRTVGESKKYGKEAYIDAGTLTAAVKSLKVDTRTTSSIKLSWLPANGAKGYIIYRKKQGETSFSEYKRISADDSSVVYWTDGSLSSATECSYRIVTYSTVGGQLKKSAFAEVAACTLPEKVQNLKAVTKSITELTLSWDKVEGASGYIVYRQGISDPSKFNVIKTIESGDLNTYTDSKLSSATVYSYRVAAYKTVNDKKFTGDYASVKSCTFPVKPAAIKATAQSTSAVKFKWSAVARVDGYNVYKVENGTYTLLATVNSDVVEYVARGLNAGTKYSFAVSGFKKYTTTSEHSVNGQKIKLDAVTAPSITSSFTTASKSTGSLDLRWSAVSGASGYCLYKKNNDTGEIYVRKVIENGSTTTYHDDELMPGESQYYRLAAYKEINGKKVLGGYKELTTNTMPITPNNLKVLNKTDKAIRIIWDEVEGIAGYKIERKASNESSYTLVGNNKGKTNNIFVDRGLKSGVTYTYRVRGYKTINNATVHSQYRTMSAKTFSQADLNNMKTEIIRLVNIERNKAGLRSLTVRSDAASGSAVRAKEIRTRFEHTRPSGSAYYTAFSNLKYTYIGENIGKHGNMTAPIIVDLWMNSPGHRANILNSKYKTISIGLYLDIDSPDIMYVAQNFFG